MPSKEQYNENKSVAKLQASIFGFIWRFAIVFTVTYFIGGLIFAYLVNYPELFASSEYPNMRTFDSIWIMLAPLLQVFRGAFLALAFLPFRKIIIESKRGWLYLFGPLWILMNVGADSVTPGTIEAFLYTDIPFSHHFFTWPEFTFQTLTFSWLFHTWLRNPKKKALSILIVTAFAIIVALLILGILVTYL